MHDDRQLVKRVKAGDRRAFEELLDRYEARVYRLVLRQVPCVQDAEDVTQEVFLGIHRNIAGFRGSSSLATWIYRVTVNHCLEFRRKRKLECVPYDEEVEMPSSDWRSDPVQAATRGELRTQVDGALDRLSPAHREVILLHEMEGLTYQECAEVLQVPVGTVKSRLSNAFTRLRDLLGGCLAGETQ